MIFVIGPHRSGTSLVAGMLSRLGVYMGPSWADQYNPTGYFEDRHFLEFNKWLVGDWRNPDFHGLTDGQAITFRRLLKMREGRDLHGVKDPRLCLTASVLVPIVAGCEEVRIVNVNRDVDASVQSLMKRNDLTEAHARKLTLTYYEARRKFLAVFEDDTLSVKYEDMLVEPIKQARRLADFVGVDDPQRIAHAAQLPDPELNHHG